MIRKYFKTDGVRGRVGNFPVTADFFQKLGWVIGKVITGNEKTPVVVIGRDTRISGDMLQYAVASGFAASQVNVKVIGVLPSPAIGYLTTAMQASLGIVITASHNPYHDNGIKIFAADGHKLPDELESEIESYLDHVLTMGDKDIGNIVHSDAQNIYLDFCRSFFPHNKFLRGLKVVLDSAHGATYVVAPLLLQEFGAEIVDLIGASPDGRNINVDCGSNHPDAVCNSVVANKADIGIAFDGDGDRLLVVDSTGEIIDGDDLLYILAQYRKKHALPLGGVVGTFMTNLGLEQALAKLEIPFCRTKVGDRYVALEMRKRNWFLGGEPSGHIICRDRMTSSDALLNALQIMEIARAENKTVRGLLQGLKKYPHKVVNVKVQSKDEFAKNAEIAKAVTEVEQKLATRGRVLLRPSGTEPVIRVMVEGENEREVDDNVNYLAQVVKKELG